MNNNKSKKGKKDKIRKKKKGLMPEEYINSPDDIEIGDDITPMDVKKKK